MFTSKTMTVKQLLYWLSRFDGEDKVVILDREKVVDVITDVCVQMVNPNIGKPNTIMLSVNPFKDPFEK